MVDVLVVDDDAAITDIIGEALSIEGIPYRTAENGAAALSLIEQRRPGVILLDINMPVMDGVRFCQALDDADARGSIAVVVMTATRDASRYQEQCGADDILGKPFQLDDLYTVVERYLPTS